MSLMTLGRRRGERNEWSQEEDDDGVDRDSDASLHCYAWLQRRTAKYMEMSVRM